MNVFSRALICALLLSGITQPVDWKYIIPWTAAVVCFGGCIGLGILSMQEKNKIKELNNEIEARQKDILKLEKAAQTGSMPRKKGSQKKSPAELALTEEINKNKELIESLQKDLQIKNEEIEGLEERLEDRDEFYNNYSPLISAMDLVPPQGYVLDVDAVNKDLCFGIKIKGKVYVMITESKFYIPSDLSVDPNVAMWRAQVGETVKLSDKKGRISKTRLPPPSFDTVTPPPLETSTLPPPITSPTSTPSGSLREKRFSIRTETALAELEKY